MTAHPKTGLFRNFGDQSIPESLTTSFSHPGFGMRKSILDGLLALALPIFAAVKSRKKKSAGKRVRKAVKKRQKRARARASRRAAMTKPARKKIVKPSRNSRSQLKGKAKAEPASKQKESKEEPLPEPVPPIGRAILLVPRDGNFVESLHPTFRWLSVGGATRYEVHWSEDSSLANKYTTVSLATEATIPVEKPLRVSATYYWRVRGGNDAGWGPWSPIASFRVLEETP